MKSLDDEIKTLEEKAHRLLHLGEEEGAVYADDLARLNKELHKAINSLYNKQCTSIEEEARLCVALLMGYNGTLYANPADEKKRKFVFERACRILNKLSPSLLKCQLLVYCYGESGKKNWAEEAYLIIENWKKEMLTEKKKQIIKDFESIQVEFHPDLIR